MWALHETRVWRKASFDLYLAVTRNVCEILPKLLLITNRTSHIPVRLVPIVKFRVIQYRPTISRKLPEKSCQSYWCNNNVVLFSSKRLYCSGLTSEVENQLKKLLEEINLLKNSHTVVSNCYLYIFSSIIHKSYYYLWICKCISNSSNNCLIRCFQAASVWNALYSLTFCPNHN